MLATMTTEEGEGHGAKLLVVEDEATILEGLVELFTKHGFVPDPVSDGLVALEHAARGGYDLIVLDLMIPGLEGLEVLRQLRARRDATPVLILTARGAEADVVAGLERGADDYVTKPFGIHELVARVRGLLRRSTRAPELPRVIPIGEASLDLDKLCVTWPGGQIELTAREVLLLEYLIARRHRAVTREELLVDVWGYRDGKIRTRTIDVHVLGLRTKLRTVPGGDAWLETVRGLGYRFQAT